MPRRFWSIFKRKPRERTYDFWRLIDHVDREEFGEEHRRKQIICDIDKTYLETEFETVLKMARVAFESAEAKITVNGATDVLTALRWGSNQLSDAALGFPRPLHFVSSSPPQLRPVLESKLMLDGLDWTSDTFKNQAYNVLKGRMDLLQHHIGYKSAAILRIVKQAGDGAEICMIGDNAESDAYIYIGVALRLLGSLGSAAYERYLEVGGVDTKVARDIANAFSDLPKVKPVGIIIRRAPGYVFAEHPALTGVVRHFDHYFQAALHFADLDFLPLAQIPTLARAFQNQHGRSRRQLEAALLQLEDHAKSEILLTFLKNHPYSRNKDELRKLYSSDFRFPTMKMEELARISESEILEHAHEWYQTMRKTKERPSRSKH